MAGIGFIGVICGSRMAGRIMMVVVRHLLYSWWVMMGLPVGHNLKMGAVELKAAKKLLV